MAVTLLFLVKFVRLAGGPHKSFRACILVHACIGDPRLNESRSRWPRGTQSIPGTNFTKAGWHWFEAPWIHQIGDVYYMSFMMNQECPGAPTTISGGVHCPTGACAPLNCTWAHYGSDLGYAMSTDGPVSGYVEQAPLMWAPPHNCGLASLENESVSLCNETGGDNAHHGMVEFPGERPHQIHPRGHLTKG